MKRGKYLVVFAILALYGNLGAATLKIESGWSLLSTGGENNVSVDCILNKLPSYSLIWKYSNKKWYAKSNSEEINNKISNIQAIGLAESLDITEGFWVYNSGDSIDINIDKNCTNEEINNSNVNDNSPNFVFGNELNLTVYDLIKQGNIFFDVAKFDDGYEKIIVNSATNVTVEDYEKDANGSINLVKSNEYNITINSDNNFSFTSNLEEGDIVINEIKQVLSVEGEDTSTWGLKYISVTGYISDETGNKKEGNWFWLWANDPEMLENKIQYEISSNQ